VFNAADVRHVGRTKEAEMLYERTSDGAIACEGHATLIRMDEAAEASWRNTVEAALGHDADPCEFCAEELSAATRSLLG